MTATQSEIRPVRAEIPQESLNDLRGRLERVRWASEVPGPGAEEIADDVHKLAEWCPAIRSMIFELEDL